MPNIVLITALKILILFFYAIITSNLFTNLKTTSQTSVFFRFYDWVSSFLFLMNTSGLVIILSQTMAPKINLQKITPQWWHWLCYLLLSDYLWYWTHRLFHWSRLFYTIHSLHHAPPYLAVRMAFQNNLVAPLFHSFTYVDALIGTLFIPTYFFEFLIFFSLILNAWQHQQINFKNRYPTLHKILAPIFITPHEHAWHHGSATEQHNFGFIFSFWDRIHGTLINPTEVPFQFGNHKSRLLMAFRNQ